MRLGATFLLIISGMFIPHDLRGVLFHVFFLNSFKNNSWSIWEWRNGSWSFTLRKVSEKGHQKKGRKMIQIEEKVLEEEMLS